MTTIDTITNTNTISNSNHTFSPPSSSPSSSTTSFTTTSSTSHAHYQHHPTPSIKQWLTRRLSSRQSQSHRTIPSKPPSTAPPASSKPHSYNQEQQHQQQSHHRAKEKAEEEERLNDSYAAFCREFTSPSPHLDSNHPPSSSADPTMMNPDQNTMHTHNNFAETRPATEDTSFHDEIRFLPVGAHGFQPLRPSFSLRVPEPAPPPGILTPMRYQEEIRLREEEEEEARRKKENNNNNGNSGNKQRRVLTWKMPIRLSLLRWWRIKATG